MWTEFRHLLVSKRFPRKRSMHCKMTRNLPWVRCYAAL